MHILRKRNQFPTVIGLKTYSTFGKFMFSKKATKIDDIFTVNLTICNECQIDGKDFVNFCGLLKGQKISKQNCGAIISSKIRRIEYYPECISFMFWKKFQTDNFVSRLTDLQKTRILINSLSFRESKIRPFITGQIQMK